MNIHECYCWECEEERDESEEMECAECGGELIDLSLYEEQEIALALLLDVTPDDIGTGHGNHIYTMGSQGNHIYTMGSQEFIVADDSDCEDLWDEYLEGYIDECLGIPEHLEAYFDRERWKEDAKIDGRAHFLASYDGAENYEEVDGTTYYIYRTN